MTLPPLSLYIHIPWCVRKCPYCDFNSHAKQDALPESAYVEALLEDLQQDLDKVQDREINTVFIGGGTPSLFSPAAYSTLFQGLRRELTFAANCEITLEANPGTVVETGDEEGQRFAGYRQAGINRLSIGVQSFDPEQLQVLGRIHSSDHALSAIDQARKAGFDNFNVDLMHGLSGQSADAARRDLQAAIDAGAPHISWYQLTIEPNTEFYKRPPTLPVENDMADIQQTGLSLLAQAGFQRYEVSAFARPGHRARHNLNYWQFGDYLALGAGGHGKITQADGRILRYQKTRKPEDYLQRGPSRTSKQQWIAAEDLPLEFMMNALRLRDGIPTYLFEQRTGLSLSAIAPNIETLQEQGLLEASTQLIQPTARGFDYLDSILTAFLP